MESVIVFQCFAAVMWITGAFLVAWFVDTLVDFFLGVNQSFHG